MRKLAVACALLGVIGTAVPSKMSAQEPTPDFGLRQVTLAAGIGNHYGWIGGQVEVHFLQERASIFGGIGYALGPLNEGGSIAFAGGVRGYTKGVRHRAYGSLGVAVVTTEQESGPSTDVRVNYGPTFTVGYQYTAGSGFTAQIGAGVGIDENGAEFVLDIGVGYTVRRQP